MDSSPRTSHPVTHGMVRTAPPSGEHGNTMYHSRRAWMRRALSALAVLALAAAMTVTHQLQSGSVTAAPGDGFVKPSPSSKTIIEGHIFSVVTGLTTCTNTSLTICRLGAFEHTISFDTTRLSMVQTGYVATGATSTTITVATAAWKENQWSGSQVHITNGPGLGQKRSVVSNTATTITVTPAFNAPPATQPGPNSIFQVGGLTDAGFIGSSGRTVNCLGATYTASSAQLQCNTLGTTPLGPTGSGNLTNLVLQANNRGVASITLSGVSVYPIEGEPQTPIDVFNGARRVILCPDPNGDGKVSSIDLSQIAQRFGLSVGNPGYTVTRDPNEDGTISSIDLSLTSQVFGLRCVQT